MSAIGIVGSEAIKFTAQTEATARQHIRALLEGRQAVVSGACHLGGIDAWAAEEGRKMGLEVIEFAPQSLQWSGGYKERNIQIAERSDAVYCITVKELPPSYKGMTFKLCYHCGVDTHVKSGGCWTTRHARKLGKTGITIVV